MAVNPENMWLANLGMNIDKFKITSTEYIEKIDPSMEKIDLSAPTTNTLGFYTTLYSDDNFTF